MMSCGNCGAFVEDDALVCPQCGARFVDDTQLANMQAQSTPQHPSMSQEAQQTPAPQIQNITEPQPQSAPIPQPIYTDGTPKQNRLRTLAGSGTFKAGAVALTAQYAITILVAIVSLVVSKIQTDAMMRELESYYVDTGAMAISIGINSVVSIISILINIGIAFFCCFAVWSMHTWAGKPEKTAPSAGLTICKVLNIFSIVGVSLVAFVVLVVLSIFMISIIGAMNYSSDAYIGLVVVLVFFLIFAIIFAISLTYYIKVLKALGGAHEICRTGDTSKKPAGFVVVFNWIFIVCGIISLIGSVGSMIFSAGLQGVVNKFLYESGMPTEVSGALQSVLSTVFQPLYIQVLNFLASTAGVVTLICMTLTLSGYNRILKDKQ